MLPLEENVNCGAFEFLCKNSFVRTTLSHSVVIIFPLVTYRDNSRRDIHVTHMKQNVV